MAYGLCMMMKAIVTIFSSSCDSPCSFSSYWVERARMAFDVGWAWKGGKRDCIGILLFYYVDMVAIDRGMTLVKGKTKGSTREKA